MKMARPVKRGGGKLKAHRVSVSQSPRPARRGFALVGNFVTSLDMAGGSVTISLLD